jgi:hypothetical protein
MLWACNIDRRWIDTQDTQYTGLDYSTQFWNLRSRTMHKFHWKKYVPTPFLAIKPLYWPKSIPDIYIYVYINYNIYIYISLSLLNFFVFTLHMHNCTGTLRPIIHINHPMYRHGLRVITSSYRY